MSNYTGFIAEFTDAAIFLTIGEPNKSDASFSLRVHPSTVNDVYNVIWNKERMGLTAQKAKEHILLALEIARISTYAPTHQITLRVPFFPNIVLPATDIEKAVEIVTKALNNYF